MAAESSPDRTTTSAGMPDTPMAAAPVRPAPLDATAQQLAEARDRYRALIQATGQITWTTTPAGVFQDAQAWCTYTGQSLEEVRDWGGMQAIHPSDREHVRQTFLQSLASKVPYDAEYRVRRFDGVYRWVLARGVPVLDADGSVREWVGFCTDITERKRAEDERDRVLEREQAARAQASIQAHQLEAVFDAVADGVFVFGSNGEVVQANAAARSFFALDAPPAFYAAPMHERGYATTVHDEDDQPLAEAQWPFSRVLQGEVLTGAHAVDIRVRTRAGQDRDLNVSGAPVRDEEGQIVSAVCVVRDVTERRRLERRTHDALDALLQMAQTLVLTPDEGDDSAQQAQAEVYMVGRRMVELTRRVLGCQRASIIVVDAATGLRHPIAAVGLSPEHARVWRQGVEGTPIDDARESPDPTVMLRLRAGEVVILDMTRPPWSERPNRFDIRSVLIAPLCIGQDLIGVLALDYAAADHTFTPDEVALAEAVARLSAFAIERERLLRKRAEAQANELALREANRRMDEFLAIASHELKTPLTGLKGYLQLAQRRTARSLSVEHAQAADLLSSLSTVHDMLQRTGEQIDRIDRLASDLVDVSRIHAGHLDMRIAPCDLAVVVRDAVEEQRHINPLRTVDLTLSPDLSAIVDGDADRLGQVVMNYLTNAFKYSAAAAPVVVGLDLLEDVARVWVRDEGAGVPATEHEHIWERFYRASGIAYRSGSGVGLGMGLYISRTIVERHGGQVGVESSPGIGSTFWFTIPLAEQNRSGSA